MVVYLLKYLIKKNFAIIKSFNDTGNKSENKIITHNEFAQYYTMLHTIKMLQHMGP